MLMSILFISTSRYVTEILLKSREFNTKNYFILVDRTDSNIKGLFDMGNLYNDLCESDDVELFIICFWETANNDIPKLKAFCDKVLYQQ